jgi:transketolase
MRKRSISMIYDLAQQDERVVFIGSDLAPGILSAMKAAYPEHHFMEGVSEQHIIGMAAGLAKNGYLPYLNTIATFMTRRCYEQIVLDAALQELPLRLIGSGGGLVYAPLGPTHLAIDDIAIMRSVPTMTVVVACDSDEIVRVMQASLTWPYPMYIRLAKGGDPIVSRRELPFVLGKAIVMRDTVEADALLLISTGIMTQRALQVSELLEKDGIATNVVHVHTVKPLDHATLARLARRAGAIVTIEEHMLTGGLGSAVLESLNDQEIYGLPLRRLALPDAFPHQYGSQDAQLQHHQLDVSGICVRIHEFLSTRKLLKSYDGTAHSCFGEVRQGEVDIGKRVFLVDERS